MPEETRPGIEGEDGEDGDDYKNLPWEELFGRAEKTLARTIEELPGPIREQAQVVTTVLERWPPDEDEDLFGEFVGFEPSQVSGSQGPIFIYLGPLYHFCRLERLEFEDEVRNTYLHELGHHLGLDETDLDDRGLS